MKKVMFILVLLLFVFFGCTTQNGLDSNVTNPNNQNQFNNYNSDSNYDLVCPKELKVCGNGCIPTNAICCNNGSLNGYCLQPTKACGEGSCYECPEGQAFCGMFCKPKGQKCCIGECVEVVKHDYNVSVKVESVTFSKCSPGTVYSGGWTVVASGTMYSDVNYVKGYGAPKVSLTPISIDSYGETPWGTYKENLDCGEWKVSEPEGYYAECVKEEGDPDSTTWTLTYSHGTIMSEEVVVKASISSYNPNRDEKSLYATDKKSVGKC